MKGIILLMPPSHNELIFHGLMSSRISEIKSLGGHTYKGARNRPKLKARDINLMLTSLKENIPSSLETQDDLVVGLVARFSWGNTRDLVTTFTKTL